MGITRAFAGTLLLVALSSTAQVARGQQSPATSEQVPAAGEGDIEEAQQLELQIAALYRQAKLTEAIGPAQRVLDIRQRVQGADHVDVATSLNNLAELLRADHQYARAESLHQRALSIRDKKLGSDHVAVAFSLHNLALLSVDRGDYPSAERLHQRARAIFESQLGPNHPHVALSLNKLARLYWITGDYDRAIELLQRALDIAEAARQPDPLAVAHGLNDLATLYGEIGNVARAIELLQRALSLSTKAVGEHHPANAPPLGNLAVMYTKKGDYARAESLQRRALDIREKQFGVDHLDVAVSLNNLAELYALQGHYKRAEQLHLRALEIRMTKLGPEHVDVALSLNNLARVYIELGEYIRAEPLLRQAIDIDSKALGPEHPSVVNKLSNLGHLYYRSQDYARAEPLLRGAVASYETALGDSHPELAQALGSLAVLYLEKGDYARAEPLHLRSLAIRKKALGEDHPEVADALNNLALQHWATDRIPSAIEYLERAHDVREGHIAKVLLAGSLHDRRLFLATREWERHLAVSLHAQGAPENPAALKLALTSVLRRKGRLLDSQVDTVANLRQHLGATEQALLDEIAASRGRIARLTLAGPGRRSPEAHQRSLASLANETVELERQLASRSAAFRAQSESVSLAAVTAAIPAGTTLVEFVRYDPYSPRGRTPDERWAGPARYAAYLVRRGAAPTWVDLGEAEAIDGLARAFLSALRDRRAAFEGGLEYRLHARALDAAVMQPIRAKVDSSTRWLIAPDGALNVVPFAALIDESGRHLVQRFSFSYLTTGRDLLRLSSGGPARGAALVIANPDFDGGGAQDTTPPSARAGYKSLPGTAQEAAALQGLLIGATLRTKGDASERRLKDVHGPELLHIATHSFFRPAGRNNKPGGGRGSRSSLLRSGLVLAGANAGGQSGEDGIMTALEAASLDLWGTKLVVLSACETGLGDIESGEGVHGLRRAFALAGAESMLMSLWKVNDEATRDLMIAYYTELRAGGGRAEALRNVQLSMLANEQLSHPYFWSSFIPIGDWRTLTGDDVEAKPHEDLDAFKVHCACSAVGARTSGGTGARLGLLLLAGALLARRRRSSSRWRRCSRQYA